MEVKDELTDDQFMDKGPEERDLVLFKKLEEVSNQVAALCKSPWRLAAPSVKWISMAIIIASLVMAGKTELALAIAKAFGG